MTLRQVASKPLDHPRSKRTTNRLQAPNVAVDVVVLTVANKRLKVLLQRRRRPPLKGQWALPGVFVGAGESLDQSARRALAEKGLQTGLYIEQLYTFGETERDPRGRVISVSYFALVDASPLTHTQTRGETAAQRVMLATVNVPWAGETGGCVDLCASDGTAIDAAFDHGDIVGMAVKRLRGKLEYAPVGFQLLPERFSLRALQHVYETIVGAPTNKDSFRRRMLASGLLESTGERELGVEHRPAELFRMVRRSAI